MRSRGCGGDKKSQAKDMDKMEEMEGQMGVGVN